SFIIKYLCLNVLSQKQVFTQIVGEAQIDGSNYFFHLLQTIFSLTTSHSISLKFKKYRHQF
ncbi:hypothetical protein Q7408_05675, partial [Glaesserella parasuis]|nr:hypothetical protein [Glaesserella parasuis]MDP0261961.1 hypothetical protein [Glaesserella parasuis]